MWVLGRRRPFLAGGAWFPAVESSSPSQVGRLDLHSWAVGSSSSSQDKRMILRRRFGGGFGVGLLWFGRGGVFAGDFDEGFVVSFLWLAVGGVVFAGGLDGGFGAGFLWLAVGGEVFARDFVFVFGPTSFMFLGGLTVRQRLRPIILVNCIQV